MSGPLAGIRVLDVTSAWAGPMATRLLAYLGAEVIKIEGPARMDMWRGQLWGGLPHRYPDKELGERPYNRNAWFNSQNHNKYAISLDLKNPLGLEIALRLAALSNVFIANFSPGVPARLGLGYDRLTEVRPDIIYVEMPAFGNDGPESHFVSWGPNLEGATGAAALQGYGDGTPVITGYAIMDPIAGLFGASAVMTAITYWRNTGKGQMIEVAQHEAGLQYVGEHILGAADGQPLEQTRGNHHAFAAPHGIFPCRGEDEWVVIACFDNKQWCGLSEAIGHPELATDSRFSSRLLRHRNQQLLAPVISCWSKEFDKHEIARILQDHGVPAAPVNKANDLNADPHLKQRGFFQPLTLPDVGTHQYPGLPFKFSKSTPHVSAPSPSFAEHNRQVLVDMLGLSEEEYAHLEREGVVADAPRAR